MQFGATITIPREDIEHVNASYIQKELTKKLLYEMSNQMPMLIVRREDRFDGDIDFTAKVTLEVNR